MKYKKYLDLLNMVDFIDGEVVYKNKEKVNKILEQKKYCCINRNIIYDRVNDLDICMSCGICEKANYDLFCYQNVRNKKFKLSTKMGYCKNYRNIQRIHLWANYDYKENTANNSYDDIEKIGKKYNLGNPIIENACNFYKQIYIDNEITSRNKIKHCIYLYCLIKSAMRFNTEIDIIDLLKNNKLSIDNFNKAIQKVNDEEKMFLHKDMDYMINNVKKVFNKDIKRKELIKKYNEILNNMKNKVGRINKKSVLITATYLISDINDYSKYTKEFKITKTTILKIKSYIK